MQTIQHIYKNRSDLFNQIEAAYAFLSDYSDNVYELSKIFKPLVDFFYHNTKINRPKYINVGFKPVKISKTKNIYTVCISGGKDSIAVAKYLIDEGHKVQLYHMRGINPAYYDEFTVIPKIAECLGVPYHIEKVRLVGSHQYIEHPMKNMLIANGAINYCLENNIYPNIVFGNYETSDITGMEFDIDAGDSRYMWDMYEQLIQTIIPDFQIYTPLKDISQTYDLIEYNKPLLINSISCMSPYRFRKSWKKRTEDKYNVELMPNRCGCCAKCCLEYMVLVDKYILDYNEDYYNHCMQILIQNTKKECGIKKPTVEQVWDRFFWYDISESHYTEN